MMSLLSADAMEMLAWLAMEERKEEWILAVARLAASERSVTVDGTVDLDVPTAAPPSLSQHCALHRSRSGPQISPGPRFSYEMLYERPDDDARCMHSTF